MKRFVGSVVVAGVAFGFVGCSEEVAKPEPPKTADGRPEGFADMMKGMEKDMKKASTSPGSLNKEAPKDAAKEAAKK